MKKNIRMVDDQTVNINLPNQIGYERIAMECSASFAKLAGFLPDRIEDVKTAVSEACLNAIEHGNKGRPEARVQITMNLSKEALMVSITDEGQGIQKKVAIPDINKKIEEIESPRGMGVFLINELVDQVEFNQKSKNGHTVKMKFNLPS